MKKGKLYLILGTSGAGKGTLRKNLEKAELDNLEFIKSNVTRKMREGEVNGDIYNFISEESFKKMIENNEFLEYEYVHNHAYYGTKLVDVEKGISSGKNIMKEIDMEGLKNILKNNPHLKEDITTIFLNLSQEKFAERIEARGVEMSKEEFNNREISLKREVKDAEIYCDHIIDTSEITPEEVFDEVLEILKK
ncbi:MAG: guanylate kinase [Candidatus Gracilibacteria bacterium]|nr:guanylate kinase [Candidatus Gracilibacteria bacterium]